MAAQRQARSAAGVKRIETKLKSAIDQENFYEAHQLYRTLYFRYVSRVKMCQFLAKNTLFEIFIFCPKIQLWFPEEIVDFFGWRTRENVVVLDFLAVDNLDFTRKIVKKNGRKTRENVKIEFLDKNLTIRKAWKFNFKMFQVFITSKIWRSWRFTLRGIFGAVQA